MRSMSRKSRDLDALGSREVTAVMKVGIVASESGGGSESESESECDCESECE